jgi:proteasome lid subunit RPN8/RPN11
MLDNKEFTKVMVQASLECSHPLEEEGGVILSRGDEYRFVKITNTHKNTPTAVALYEADKQELGKCMFDLYKEGWLLFSSFHTHPQFAPFPSNLDLNTLFQGFQHNVIYAPLYQEAFSYSTWENGSSVVKKIINRQKINATN